MGASASSLKLLIPADVNLHVGALAHPPLLQTSIVITASDPKKHHRRSVRLKGYDYAQPGAYFVTICTHKWTLLFGQVLDGKMILNSLGKVIKEEWLQTADSRPLVDLDEFVIMPNHLHGIIMIVNGRGIARYAPTITRQRFGKMVPGSLSAIVRAFSQRDPSGKIRRCQAHQPDAANPGRPRLAAQLL